MKYSPLPPSPLKNTPQLYMYPYIIEFIREYQTTALRVEENGKSRLEFMIIMAGH
jgi:hypothetical protein